MTTTRRAIFAALIVAGCAGAFATAAQAEFEPTAEDRAACDKDAFRLCLSSMPSKEAVMLCLRQKKAELSPRCREQFRKHGS